ncbi:MAG TPA: HAD family hydrolase [Kofleriaceae bacterium]
MTTHAVSLALLCAVAACQNAPRAATDVDPLPSWNDNASKRSIVAFVGRVTKRGDADYVPPAERIAVFDNDGTLWVEQPMYTQLAFALDRVKTLAPSHPVWTTRQPFKAVLEGDKAAIAATGERGVHELVMATHANMTTDEFAKVATDWLATARHPRFRRPYTTLVYQPMLELLAYLRAQGFTTYVVSGGGVEFLRPWTERVYGIPPRQVIGSRIALRYRSDAKAPALDRLPKADFIDDGPGKPVAIEQMIGVRPILAFGNSDGDFEMLEWTTAGRGRRLGLILHHTDDVREFAYDRDTHFGLLSRALDEAAARRWVVVDMKRDWRTVFPP